jgi:hypothetical protein
MSKTETLMNRSLKHKTAWTELVDIMQRIIIHVLRITWIGDPSDTYEITTERGQKGQQVVQLPGSHVMMIVIIIIIIITYAGDLQLGTRNKPYF